MIERKNPRCARDRAFSPSHTQHTGQQFEGLYENIMAIHVTSAQWQEKNGVEVVDFGMIDSSEKAYGALAKIKAANVVLLFCNMVTYATSVSFCADNA